MGRRAAAGSGSGNEPPLCCPREGTGAMGGDRRNPGSGGGRCRQVLALYRLQGSANGWVPTLDCWAHGRATQTTAGSGCVDRTGRRGPPEDNSYTEELYEPSR